MNYYFIINPIIEVSSTISVVRVARYFSYRPDVICIKLIATLDDGTKRLQLIGQFKPAELQALYDELNQ